MRAELDLRACCGSSLWASSMARARPFESVDDLMAQASRIWQQLPPDAHREAFAAHPRIGQRPEGSDAHARWSRREQSSASGMSDEMRAELAQMNKQYDERFGFVFLICATGKTAEEMLASAKERLNNDPSHELAVAAAEQEAITQIRLRRLLTC
jgi:OHCU decarboxylase